MEKEGMDNHTLFEVRSLLQNMTACLLLMQEAAMKGDHEAFKYYEGVSEKYCETSEFLRKRSGLGGSESAEGGPATTLPAQEGSTSHG